MGSFLNRGIEEFKRVLNSQIYVDKTDIIGFLNRVINTEQAYLCVSRPRRFGKSVTANMIAAYYEKGNNSLSLFEGKKLSALDGWDCELNKYNVIRIDVADILASQKGAEEALNYIEIKVFEELKEAFPEQLKSEGKGVSEALAAINASTGEQFVIIIDEWDAFYRDEKFNSKAQERYINFLKSLFKGNRAKKFTALAYITGILPIKKYNSESALNNFMEYTMISPKKLAPYIGFTEQEVQQLCKEYNMDYAQAQEWYDGYSFSGTPHIYGPNSVVQAMFNEQYENYWSQTVAFNSLSTYISMNFDGLKDAVVKMLSGFHIPVNVFQFQNDMTSFRSKDDVLTILVHLGYLAYDSEKKEVYIPNYEVRQIFEENIAYAGWDDVVQTIKASDKLLDATLAGDADTVAGLIEKSHEENTSIINYNDENSLACVISLAYYSARKDYIIFRELPTGKGFADIVLIPKYNAGKPPIVIELKWNKSAVTAISQIKDKKYVSALQGYKDDVVLVGINYDKKTKKHECVIEKTFLG